MNNTNHLYSLDLLRGFSGYGVAYCHLNAFLYNNSNYEYYSLLFVEFFFILIGLFLYPQLIKVLNNKKNLMIFYKRRWIRTLPLYVIFLLLVSSIFDANFTNDFFKYLFFVQKISPNFLSNDYYPVAWSLSIEEFFYLFFPLIILLMGKKNIILKTIILFISLITLKVFFADMVNSNFFRTGTFFRFDAILLGFILRYFHDKLFKIKYFSFLLLLFSLYFFNYFKDTILGQEEVFFIKVLFVLFLQVISCLVLNSFFIFEYLINFNLFKKFSTLVSRQTYSVYLMHIILIYLFEKLNLDTSYTLIFYMFLLFSISTFVYYFIERPLLKMRPKLQ